MLESHLVQWIDDPLSPARADGEHERRLTTGADDDVLGPGRAVDEVPRPQGTLLTFDDQQALAAQDEEYLFACFAVVHRHRLSRRQHVEVHA